MVDLFGNSFTQALEECPILVNDFLDWLSGPEAKESLEKFVREFMSMYPDDLSYLAKDLIKDDIFSDDFLGEVVQAIINQFNHQVNFARR